MKRVFIHHDKRRGMSHGVRASDTKSPTSRRYNPQEDTGTRHGFSNNMAFLCRLHTAITLRGLSRGLTLTVSLGSVITLLDDQVLSAVVVTAGEV
jgi:hypothetical protein